MGLSNSILELYIFFFFLVTSAIKDRNEFRSVRNKGIGNGLQLSWNFLDFRTFSDKVIVSCSACPKISFDRIFLVTYGVFGTRM